MRKLVGNRLMLAGFYLVIGLVLTLMGRTQAANQNGFAKPSTINQHIVSAFRHLITQGITNSVTQ